jgi:aminopeptidase N
MTNNPLRYRTARPSFLLLLIALSVQVVFGLRKERLVDTWRPTHYEVTLTLNEQLSEISSASTRIEVVAVKKLSLIDFDFGDLTTDRVTLDSKPVTFVHKNGRLEIPLQTPVIAGTRLIVTIDYHGKPKDGLILTNDKDNKPSAIGDNWPDRVHQWIPSLDHPSAKATVTFNVTAPVGKLVVANGRFDKVETTSSGSRTWTYTESVPIPPYCMIIGVGDFARLEPSQKSLTPLSYYVPHSDQQFTTKGFGPAIQVLEFINQTVAPYPYEKLALIVGATRFGGMENSSAIVFASTLFNPNPNAKMSNAFGISAGTVNVVAHEIAHQWFGDSVTESTWSDLWLSEGFATYFAGLFIQRYEGEAAFQTYMKQAAEASLAYEKKTLTPIFDRETEDLFKLLSPNNYQKGAWVLHMLRSQLGDDAFFRGLRNYYANHKNGIASSEDLRVALEKASGKNLRTFFGRWIYDSGHPQYELSSVWDGKRRNLRLLLTQMQPGNPFQDPVPISIVTSKGTRELVLRPTRKRLTQTIAWEDQPMRIEVDPANTLLKEVTVK